MGLKTQEFYSYFNPQIYSEIVEKIDDLLRNTYGMSFETGDASFFVLEDYEIADDEFHFESEEMHDDKKAQDFLIRLKNHRAGGSLSYVDKNGFDFLVSFGNFYEELDKANYVNVSVQHTYYLGKEEAIKNMLFAIHTELNCVRTIGGWCDFPWLNFHSDLKKQPWEQITEITAEKCAIDWKS